MTKTTGNQGRNQQPSALENFKPLLVDVAVPLGAYYLLKDAFGMSTFAALAWSSVVPAARTVWSLVRERTANALALLILTVNVVGLALSFVSGDPRLMLAKDGAVSSTVAIGILVSVALGRPMMTEGMKPFLVKGDAAKEAAWQRLVSGAASGAADFRRKERAFSVVWGVALLVECVARVVGAYTIPVDTMVWLGGVLMAGVMVLAFLVSGAVAAGPMEHLLADEAKKVGEVDETPKTPKTPETPVSPESAVAAQVTAVAA
ncbi:VC0807 family protein [Streptomyces sp. DSM 110735]|uniref:VC0807 family protein n=1 Tax=Streptomyces sp. DSM 110735 TaxID=2775031 RepID=UPI001F5BBCCF|nr:VC0807 family protein [Streptomyces sp. DSM 110735]